jgi:hypothetical protein
VRGRRRTSLAALGFLGGVALGALVWSVQMRRHRRNLFSARPLRRLAALGYLSGQPTPATAQLLRDYVKWEGRSVLRRRGERVLRRIEAHLH